MTHKAISVLAALLNYKESEEKAEEKAEIIEAITSVENLILENETMKRKLDRIKIELER